MLTSPIIAGATDVGRVRTRNEDALILLPTLGAAIVADGMGGVPGGDVASRVAAGTVEAALQERLPGIPRDGATPDVLGAVLESALTSAHLAVREAAGQDPDLADMGTTLTALIVPTGVGVWALGHVGDSRAYRMRDGALVQLTRDQTWIQDLVDEGRISAEQALFHPYRHVLSQCIGSPDAPEPQISTGIVCPGDLYLLCSDGLAGMLDDSDLAMLLERHVTPDADAEVLSGAAARLVDAANEHGGEDNITLALVMIGEDGAPTPTPPGA